MEDFVACYRAFRKGRGRWHSFWRALWAVTPTRGN